MRLYSDWGLPKKEKVMTSARVVTEEELAERRLMQWCDKMEKRMKEDYKTLGIELEPNQDNK